MRRDSYLKIAAELLGVLAALALVAAFGLTRPAPRPVTVIASAPVPKPAPRTPPKPLIVPRRETPPAPAPTLDREAIAEAEAQVASARNDRARAEARAAEAADRLGVAQTRAATAVKGYRTLASSIRDPGPRFRSARARGEVLKVERDRLQGELMALNEAPRPRRKVLIDKSPVARPTEGEEFHFEVLGDRIAFIDLERLLDRVKTDARSQIRMSNGTRPIQGTVGPVGAFSIQYEVSRLDDGSNPRMGNFGLSGWEVVPEREVRGETFAMAAGPVSEFSRAINRLNPARDSVTMWVYPDGFPLYRQMREALHARGFLVAARPLPEGMTIKGSPTGSTSAAQ